MRYRVLGQVEVADGRGVSAPRAGSRQGALLAILLAHPGETLSADRLADALWGTRQPADPAAALQSQISRLRCRLGRGAGLETVGRGYRLRPAPGDLDAAEFERLLRAARATDDPGQTLRLLDAALSLWRGPPYGEHAGHPDVHIDAERLEELRSTAREERAAALLGLGRAEEAAAAAMPLVAEQPLRERTVELLVEAWHQAGRVSEALAAYERYRRRLAEEFGVDPGEQLRRLHLRILRGEPDTRLRAVLPRPVTSYVSRGDEVTAVAERVRQARHVTFTGPGGVGKTRLAIEVAGRLVGAFPDGVWFCDLATVPDPDAVPGAVAAILAIQRRHGRSMTQRLVDVLGGRCALLVLDNCEHVRAAAARLAQQIVEHTGEVHILATSREPLGLPGEQRIVVTPLSEDGAARLFSDRAAAARPGMRLTEDDLAAVRRICREVAGLPLGVELAAARTAARTPVEIAADLAGRVDQLRGSRSGLARHRSVTALVDWSLDRLADHERDLAEHLAVFAGGCTAEAAAAVVGREVADTADLLVALTDCSVVTPHQAMDHTRYTVLEPVRARAEQRLRQRDLLTHAHRRHAAYFARLTARASTGLRTTEAARWLDTLDRELANLRAACRWSLDTDDGETALGLLAPLYIYAWSRMPAELSEWAEAACSRPTTSRHPALPAVLGLATLSAWRRGDLPHARRLAEQATHAEGPPEATAVAFQASADIPFLEGRLDEAIARYRAASERARAAGDTFFELMSAADVALARGYAGDDGAAAAADEVVARAEALGAPWAIAYACYTAGEVRLERSPDKALPHLRRALRLARSVGCRFTAAAAGLSGTSIAVRHGAPHAALADLMELLDEWHRAGWWIPTWLTVRLCIDVFVRLGQDEPAAQLLGALSASSTAGPAYGPDAERLARAEAVLRSRLASYDALAARGATLGDEGAIGLAHRTLRSLPRA